MRDIERLPLSDTTHDVLCKRTLAVANAGNAQPTRSGRARARRVEALRLWDLQQNQAFEEIRDTLRAMAPGREFCMYCEFSIGDAIEHFWPKHKYPWRAFLWENYLWSCSICNGRKYKGERFPLDKTGRPLLINPTEDDPREHLEFTPQLGKYVGRTPKGEKTIEILGFDRRSGLDDTRRAIWLSVQLHIISYAEACANGDGSRALEVRKTLSSLPHASLLHTLIELQGTPGGESRIESPRCVAAIAAHPEIKEWL